MEVEVKINQTKVANDLKSAFRRGLGTFKFQNLLGSVIGGTPIGNGGGGGGMAGIGGMSAMGTIGVIIAGITAISVGIKKLISLTQEVSPVLKGTFDILHRSFAYALKPMADAIGTAILPFAKAFLRTTVKWQKFWRTSKKEGFKEAIGEMFTNNPEKTAEIISEIVWKIKLNFDTIGNVFSDISLSITSLGDTLGNVFSDISSSIRLIAENFITNFTEGFGNLITNLGTIFTDIVTRIGYSLSTWKTNLTTKLNEIINGLITWWNEHNWVLKDIQLINVPHVKPSDWEQKRAETQRKYGTAGGISSMYDDSWYSLKAPNPFTTNLTTKVTVNLKTPEGTHQMTQFEKDVNQYVNQSR